MSEEQRKTEEIEDEELVGRSTEAPLKKNSDEPTSIGGKDLYKDLQRARVNRLRKEREGR
jgi:hypothetical protein